MNKQKKYIIYLSTLVVLLLVFGIALYKLIPQKENQPNYSSYNKENEILKNVEKARDLADELDIIKDKEKTNENLDEIVKNEKREILRKQAYNSIQTAKFSMLQTDINVARFRILTLPEEIVIDRTRFNELLDKVQYDLMVSAVEAMDVAVASKNVEEIITAVGIYNNISMVRFNEDVKNWVENELTPKYEKIKNKIN